MLWPWAKSVRQESGRMRGDETREEETADRACACVRAYVYVRACTRARVRACARSCAGASAPGEEAKGAARELQLEPIAQHSSDE
eukprot:2359241-Pleurochrysis_carterae.AAC.1